MALMIAGERSGVGKTTLTLAILSFLAQKSARVQSFKVGPDYIDPMFHEYITQRPCRNLDPLLTSEAYVKSCFAQHSESVDYALIEGVMGLFDGVENPHTPTPSLGDFASSAHVARLLGVPVVLVVDASRLSTSVAAIVSGYRGLDPSLPLKGVILNRVASDRHLYLLETALAHIHVPLLGALRRHTEISLSDRHLGLIPVDELPNLTPTLERLAALAATNLNWDLLLPLLETSPISLAPNPPLPQFPVRLALARDRAFNFYYADNLDILTAHGAELIPWSPLADQPLPPQIQGIYLGGGFPEVFASSLAANQVARSSLQKAITQGIPTLAECGGLMYLSETLVDFEAKAWPMTGILPTRSIMGAKLTLGYRQAIAQRASSCLEAGQIVWGHEFHRSYLETTPPQPLYQLQGLPLQAHPPQAEGWISKNLHASYLHLHFGQSLTIPQKFLRQCLDFSERLD
jgi:cobyrinic acid a,c-diamide synthase